MTTTIYLFPTSISNVLGSATIDPGAWSDATDDGTSVQMEQDYDGIDFTRFDRVKGLLPPLDSSLGTPEAIRVKMRVRGTQFDGPPGAPLPIVADVALTNTPNSPFVRVGDTNNGAAVGALLYWKVTPGAFDADFAVDLADDAPLGGSITGGDYYDAAFTTPAAVATMLQSSGSELLVQIDVLTPQPHSLSQALTIYALWVEVDVPDAIVGTAGQPPLRMTNRDDHYTSARRLTGSRSRQGGNRLTGYL